MSAEFSALAVLQENPDLWLKAKEALYGLCKDGQPQDWKGHYKQGAFFREGWVRAEERLQEIVRDSLAFGLRGTDLATLVQAIEEGVLLETPIPLSSMRDLRCPFCGEVSLLGFDGKRLCVIGDPCPYPEGLVTEWELNVPSGKIVVANDLRTWFPADGHFDVNLILGTHQTTLGYAKVGMAHGFVGNTSPGVFQSGDRYVIGSYQEQLWDDETRELNDNPEPCPWGESVASVCTDLWWFSIVDHDECLRRVKHYTPDTSPEEFLNEGVEIVNVRPGVYKFRQEQGVDRDATLVEFASFEWVREPDEVQDFLKQEIAKNHSATEVLIEHCLAWPSMYMGLDRENRSRENAIELWKKMSHAERTQCLAGAANQIMCVLGNGVDWHENGFPRSILSDEAKQLAAEFGEVPYFDFEVGWYPISAGFASLCLGAGIEGDHGFCKETIQFAPTFAKLGLNICQNALKFGSRLSSHNDKKSARKVMRLFADCYFGLRKQYPDVAFDEEFDRWMRETDLKKYIAKFEFLQEKPYVWAGSA